MDDYDDLDKLGVLIKKNHRKEKKSFSFKSLMPVGIIKHINEVSKITFLSEISGIIGLIFSIVIFFYAQKISNQQNEIEQSERSKETNNILDNGMLNKILLVQDKEVYKESKYKFLLDKIINAEYVFYEWAIIGNIIQDRNNPYNQNESQEAKKYMQAISDFQEQQDVTINNILQVLFSMTAYSMKHDPIIQKLKLTIINSMVMNGNAPMKTEQYKETMKKIAKQGGNKINIIIKQWENKEIDDVEAANEVLNYLRENDVVTKQICFYRKMINCFDVVLTQEMLLLNKKK